MGVANSPDPATEQLSLVMGTRGHVRCCGVEGGWGSPNARRVALDPCLSLA